MTNNKINKLKNIIQLYTNTENMTNNKLAVEWLAKSYVDLLTKLNNEEISLKEFEIQYIELLEQAKEMEKERIETAYNKGTVHGIDYPESTLPLTGEQYYNETYVGGEQ
jgi:Asp-tRNA(Asn)/Glu-tRNA(Gln) amidotransferase B subunit